MAPGWIRSRGFRIDGNVLCITPLHVVPAIVPHAHTFAYPEPRYALADSGDVPTGLMPRLAQGIRVGQFGSRKHGLAAQDVHVPVRARRHRKNFHEDFARPRLRHGHLLHLEPTRFRDLKSPHLSEAPCINGFNE